jgi:hypothetical protein
VSFLFGSGARFGFPRCCAEIGLPKENLLLSLLNFNLGVESRPVDGGFCLSFHPDAASKSKPWEPRVVATISGVIMALGLVLFVERAFFRGVWSTVHATHISCCISSLRCDRLVPPPAASPRLADVLTQGYDGTEQAHSSKKTSSTSPMSRPRHSAKWRSLPWTAMSTGSLWSSMVYR